MENASNVQKSHGAHSIHALRVSQSVSSASQELLTTTKKGWKEKASTQKWIKVVNVIFSLIVVGPLSITAWRGFWDLLEMYLLPTDFKTTGSWVFVTTGTLSRLIVHINQPFVEKLYNTMPGKLRIVFLGIFLFLTLIMMVTQWIGIFNILDIYTGFGNTSNGICLSVALLFLLFTKSSTNLLAPPLCIMWDYTSNVFRSLPRFRTPVCGDVA